MSKPYVVERTLDSPTGPLSKGTITRLEWVKPESLEVLLRINAVREIRSPPLSELKGWDGRADILGQLEILDGWDFLAALESSRTSLLELFDSSELREMETQANEWLALPEAFDPQQGG